MVAVVAGNGLGLLGTSLQQLGLSPGGQSSLGQSGASQYVNIATGNLVLQSQDERLVEQGLLAGLVRTYNSLGTSNDFGSQGSWLLGLDRSLGALTGTLDTAGSTITRAGGDGAEEVFSYDATRGLYVASDESGAEDTLQWDAASSTWTYTAGGSRNQEIYSQAGVLTQLTDAESGATYGLTYNGSNQLIAVTASDGEALELGYDASGRISTLSTLEVPPGGGTAVTQSRVTYGYDTLGRLTSVTTDLTPDDTTDSSVFTTTYTYDADSSRIASLTQSDGLTVNYTYAQDAQGNYRIATVTTGNGEAGTQTLSFSYDTVNRTTTVADAAGRAWVYGYDANGNLTSITSPAVNGQYQVTSYAYTADGHLASVTDALGNQTIYQYDARGNRILERDADGNTITWTYNADDQVLTRTVYQVADPDGSDPGSVASASTPSTTWYVYDDGSDGLGRADQLRYVIDADGNVSETQYNSQGQVSLTRRFAGAEYDTSALSQSAVPTLSAMNTWVSSQDLTQTTRVDYAYDTAGRLTSKTAWDNVDASGNGVADVGESITTYVYDAQGLLRQQVTERGSDRTVLESSSYSYDGLGRLIGSTDALGNVTTYAYGGGTSSGTLTVTYANGLVHTEVRNSAGELVTVTESASDGSSARTTHYIYDAEGQLRAVQDPSGAITYTFYDEAGRVSGTVDAMGAVTQYVRDADGRVVETKQYAAAVDTTSWLSNGAVSSSTPTDLSTIVPAASPDDRTTLSLYDAAGMHVADVDALGNVSTYAYDGAGNLTTTTRYATTLSATQLGALQSTPSWSALQGDLTPGANDRIIHTLYDIANRAVATIDAAGYVTTTAYDAAGRIIKTTAYANGLTAAQLAGLGDSPSLATVLGDITTSGADQTTRNYYDDAGRLIAQVDADGYLTTTAYDETTHASTTVRYGQALSAAQLAALTGHESLADLTADVAGSPSQTSTQEYDADGLLVSATAVDGTTTAYVYDQVGHLLSTTVTPPANAGTVRTTSAAYDVFGDVLTATDAANATTTYTFNVLGQKVLGTDPLGNNTWYFYDADGRLVYTVKGIASGGTQNALGEVTATTYNAFGQATGTTRYAARLDLTSLALSTSTSLGAIATALQAIANPAQDATTTYTYTLAGQIATALHGTVQNGTGYVPAYTNAYTYDAFGELTSTQRQLSQAGQALTATNSAATTYSYDARGERIGEVDDAGGLNRTTDVTYDAFGRITSRTDGNGNTTTYGYDALGRQISVSETVQGAVRTSSTTYDAYGRVLTETDAMGNITAYQYSADTHTITVTTPDGVKFTTIKDAYGDTLSVTDSLNNTTSYTYDGDGRLLTRTDALGNVTTDAYDANGDLISTTDANGAVTTYTYDAAGRVLTRTVDSGDSTHLNLTTTYAYDGRGQKVSVTDPNGVQTTYGYDADGNVLSVVKDAGTGNLNLITTYTWDGAGHQLSVTEGAGTAAARTTQYTYDNLGRLTQTQVDPNGLNLTTTYAYDANNNLVARTDADGNVTRYVYDEANERVFTIDAAGGVTRWWYDADGRVTCTCAYATAMTASQLSSLGSAPSIAQVAGMVVGNSAADQVSYTVYTNDGHVGYTIDGLGYVTEVRHDADGRVSETLAYANAINVSSLQAQLQQGTAFSSLAAVVSSAGNTDQNAHATLNLYDADGHVRFVVQQDTVNGQLVGIATEKRYDADGQVVAEVAYGTPLVLSTTQSLSSQLTPSSVAQSLSGATDLHQTGYVYDGAGRLRYTIDPGNYVNERRYDSAGNLVSELRWFTAITVPASLTLASVGAAVAATNASTNSRYTNSTYDHAGRLVSTADNLGTNATYTYDALGQKLSYKNRDGATWTYTYDTAGRVIEQDTPPVAASSYTTGNTLTTATAAIKTRFTYDANGNVLTRTEAYGTAVARTISYAYDSRGNQIKTTYPGGSYASVTYNALGQAVVNRDVNGHYEYKSYDQDGRVAYEVDGNGYVTAYSYDAYGNQTQVTRYASALNTGALTGWSAGQALSMAQVQEGLVAGGSDRTITTSYDQLNQKLSVIQGSISFVYYTGSPSGQWSSGSPTTMFTYDAYGNVTSTSVLLQDAYGTAGQAGYVAPVWATTFDYYDALNRKTLEVDPVGYVSAWAYDATGAVKSYTEYAKAISTAGLSTNTTPALPPAGDAASGFDRIFHYGYDSIGRKTNEIDYGGYSSDVNNAQSIAQSSVNKTFSYDGEGRVTSLTVNGAKTVTTYDALGRVTSVLEPARSVLLSNWQALLEANPTQDLTWSSLYEPGSPLTTITYDALGNALSTTRLIGSSAAGGSQTTYDHYDVLGRVSSETDAAGTVYSNAYDAAGNLLSTTHTLNGSTVTSTYTYDADNQRLSSVTKRTVGSTTYTDSATYAKYNAFGEISAKGDGVVNGYSSTGYEQTYSYDLAGNLITATDSTTGATHTYSHRLDGVQLGDAWFVTGGASQAYTSWIVDAAGRHVGAYLPSYSTGVGQNAAAIHSTYDRWGNVLSTTDARGYTTTYEYDSQNHLIEQTEPRVMVVASDGRRYQLSPTKEWYYDINGHLTGVTDENGHTTTNAYDAAGELISTTDAVGAVTHYAYDGLGRQVAKQTPITSTSSHITWQDLDALGRVIQQGDFLLNGSTLVKSIQQQYVLDQDGNRIKVTDAIGNASYYSYDSQGRVLSSQTSLQHAAGVSHTYAYDVNGNKIKETTADGDSETWSYDYFGRVRSHTDLSGATYGYTYDASSGLLTQETSTWNPAAQGQSDPSYLPSLDRGSSSTTQYQYFADGKVSQVKQITGSQTTDWTNYQYDADGNETVQATYTTDGAGLVYHSETISSYDSHNRLSEVTVENPDNNVGMVRTVYNYDNAGNRRAVFVQSAYNGTAINTGTIGGPTVAAIPAQTVQPGAALNFNAAAYFTDPLGFGVTYNATGMPSWMHINSAGVLFGTAPKPAASWTVTVTGTDALGNSVSATFTISVPNLAPVFNGAPTDQTIKVGTAFSFTQPAATDPNGDPITYTSAWSDGTAFPSWMHFNASTLTWSGTAPTTGATYRISYWAKDSHGAWVGANFGFTVAASSTPPVYHGGIGEIDFDAGYTESWQLPSTAFSSTDGGTLSYSITKSDGTALPSPPYTFNSSTGLLTAALPAYTNDRTFGVIIKATDTRTGLSTSVSTDIYITGVGSMMAVPQSTTSSTQVDSTSTPQTVSTQATTQTTTAPNIQAYWFTYDYDNRVDISGGTLNSAGQIVVDNRRGSMEQTYDLAGDVVKELTYSGSDVQTFSYDARGEMIGSVLPGNYSGAAGASESRQYDADGRLILDTYHYAPNTWVSAPTTDQPSGRLNISGWVSEATTYYYDADGRVIASYDYGRVNADTSYWSGIARRIDAGTLDPSTEISLPAMPTASQAAQGNGYGVLNLISDVAHGDASTGAGGYDAEGNAVAYSYSVLNQSTYAWTQTAYTVNYLKKDGYLEKATTGTGAGLVTTTDTSYYDNFGRRIDIVQHNANNSPPDDVRAFAYDANGQILEEREGSPTSDGTGITPINPYFADHYAYVDGQQVAHVDEEGTIDVLSGLTDFSNSDQGSSNYVVQDGDTLQSVAQQVYGDSNLWYVIADANGLQSTSTLTAGESLKVPEVKTTDNTANTFKPYNPLEISGSTTPSLPQVPQPPPSNHHCNALAAIVVIAVAVIVSVATYGALTGAAVQMAGWEAGAVAGAAGSAASQLAGDALGVSHGFDWGQVLVGAVGGAIGGAVASKLGGMQAFNSGATLEADGLNIYGNAIAGAADYVGTYEAEKLVGEPAHFSWAGLVASAAGSVAGGAFGPNATESKAGAGEGDLWSRIESRAAQDIVTRETSVALGDNHVQSWQQIGEDIFGNALGNAIGDPAAAAIKEYESERRSNPTTELDSAFGSSAYSGGGTSIFASQTNSFGNYSYANYTLGTQTYPDSFPAMLQGSGASTAGDTSPSSSSVLSDESGMPDNVLYTTPPVVVTADPRFTQDYFNQWVWAMHNHVAPPPVTTSQAKLNAYRQQMTAAANVQLASWDKEFVSLNPQPAPPAYDNPYLDLYNTINNAAGKLLPVGLHNFVAAGLPGGTFGSEAEGFLEEGANTLINLTNAALHSMPGVQAAHLAGYDLSLPTFSMDRDELGGAALFDVATLAAGGIGSDVRLAGAVGGASARTATYTRLAPDEFSAAGPSIGGTLDTADAAPVEPLETDVPNRLAEVEASASGSPSHLVSGQAAEAEQLEILSSSGKVPFTPTPEQINSAAFKVIVGDAKYTRSGDLVSTIYDGLNADGLAEIKNGSSALSSSYQLRLQTYGSLVNDTPLTIYTSRPVNPVFQDYLTRWGVSVKPLPH